MSKRFLKTIAVASTIGLTVLGPLERAWGMIGSSEVYDEEEIHSSHPRWLNHFNQLHPDAQEQANAWYAGTWKTKQSIGSKKNLGNTEIQYHTNAIRQCITCQQEIQSERNITAKLQQKVTAAQYLTRTCCAFAICLTGVAGGIYMTWRSSIQE